MKLKQLKDELNILALSTTGFDIVDMEEAKNKKECHEKCINHIQWFEWHAIDMQHSFENGLKDYFKD